MANSIDADQTVPREKKTGRDLNLGPYNGAGKDGPELVRAFREIFSI